MSFTFKFDNTDLLIGLVGMSRAIDWNNMSAHPPAAFLAAHFFCREQSVEAQAVKGVQELVEKMVSGSNSIWYRLDDGQPVTNAALFTPRPPEVPDEALITKISAALEQSIDGCRASGHNTIFASLALKALNTAPEYASPAIIDGITELLLAFEGAGPGNAHIPGKDGVFDARQFLGSQSWDIPPYKTIDDMVSATCKYIIPDHFTRKGVGGPIHVINHAAALLDLSALGYPGLVQRGLAAHHEHLTLWLNLPPFPELDIVYRTPSQHDPRTGDYWAQGVVLKDRGGYEHRIKFLYGAFRLAEALMDPKERAAFLVTASHLY